MKSAIFESMNDRSNIANAYLKMVNEANEEMNQQISEIGRLYEGKTHPICIYEWGPDGNDYVMELAEVRREYKDPSWYEKGNDDYYISLAFDAYEDDELYRKLLDENEDFYIPPEKAISLPNGFLNTKNDLYNALKDIGMELDFEAHKDYDTVKIPEYAVQYIEYNDDSNLEPEDKEMIDDYLNGIKARGYELIYDGEVFDYDKNGEFGFPAKCVKYYLVKSSEKNESVEETTDGWFDSHGYLVKDLPEECIKDCTVPGRDAYESCKYWVNELGFANGLDIPLAKGYLKSTGGWEADEIASFDDNETAIRILWILANDAKDGMDVLYIGDAEPFDDDDETSAKKDEMLNQTDIDKLKKKNPKLKDISEER